MAPVYADLAGKVVVVTMSATGIGAAIAETFAGQGATVVITSRSKSRLQEIAHKIQAAGGTPIPLEVDVTSSASVTAAVTSVIATTGRLDVLVNNAGGFDRTSAFSEVTDEAWAECLARNMTSAFLWSREVAPHMRNGGGGTIINVSSTAGETSLPHSTYAPYGSAKAGVIGLTRHLARELAPSIRVNCVAPGPTATPRWSVIRGPATETPAVLEQVALARVSDPAEQAWPVLFLASAAASYITGITLPINGGRFMR